MLAVPLMREGVPIGVIGLRRNVVQPFSDNQVALVKTFADQAVIAIENVRLFQELKESLEQQTATSEILGVIASSPTDIQPVLNTVAANAARLCEATDAQIRLVEADGTRLVASFGTLPAPKFFPPTSLGSPTGRAILKRETTHIHDISTPECQAEFSESSGFLESIGIRTVLATPLLRHGVGIGAILIRRTEVRPFADKQIKLLETFAAQAVIAIENVRLFRELRRAQCRVAGSSRASDGNCRGARHHQPVADRRAASARRHRRKRGAGCGVDDVVLRLHEGDTMVLRAHFGRYRSCGVAIAIDEPRHRWMRGHGTLHVPDIRAQDNFPLMSAASDRWRTYLAAPLRLQGEVIGTLGRTSHRGTSLHSGANQAP